MTKVIKFYKKDDEFGFMSNFFRREVVIDGRRYATTEHYYQAMKFGEHEELYEWVKTAPTPHLAFKASRAIGMELMRKDWDSVKVDIMRRAVRAKFFQNKDLAERLVETGDAELVEDSPTDWFWGCGADGKGANMLGKILMEVRQDLKDSNRFSCNDKRDVLVKKEPDLEQTKNDIHDNIQRRILRV